MTILALPLLATLMTLAGGLVAGASAPTRERRLVVSALAGMLLVHALLAVADALGVRWSAAAILVPLALLAAAGVWRSRTRSSSLAAQRAGVPAAGLGWGDAVALLAVFAFAVAGWTLWSGNPDFVYHWGLKGHRFALAGAVDYGYLTHPWSWVLHPDYPNLFPELLAATRLLAGRWHEPSLVLWSPLMVTLLVVAVRGALVEHEVPPLRRHAVVAAVACACAAFGVGHEMAGAADWLPALALAGALPALLDDAGGGDVEIGIAAALAAASKIEGLVLAAVLVAVQLGRHAARRRWPRPVALAALLLPSLLVAAHWTAMVTRHGLFQSSNAGALSLGKLAQALPAMRQSVLQPAWHLLPFLLLLLPALLFAGRTRAFATVALLQLAFYLWTYAATPLDSAMLALTSFPRLVLHLLPATMAAATVAWLRAPDAPSPPEERT